jgi:hypothetical protein
MLEAGPARRRQIEAIHVHAFRLCSRPSKAPAGGDAERQANRDSDRDIAGDDADNCSQRDAHRKAITG